MGCSPPGSSVYGISHARILEWVATSFSRRSPQPRDQNHISCIGRQILYHWATREAHGLNHVTLKFPMVTYRCESWTVKKAKWQRIDAFKLWCWRRLLKVPWTARRLNQPILREMNPEYSLGRLMQKLQYFGYLMQTDDSLESLWCWERSRAEGEEGIRGWNGWMASPMQWTRTSGDGEGQRGLVFSVCCSPCGCKETQLGNWTTTLSSTWCTFYKEYLIVKYLSSKLYIWEW